MQAVCDLKTDLGIPPAIRKEEKTHKHACTEISKKAFLNSTMELRLSVNYIPTEYRIRLHNT